MCQSEQKERKTKNKEGCEKGWCRKPQVQTGNELQSASLGYPMRPSDLHDLFG